MAAVTDRIPERFCKFCRDQYRKVCIFCLAVILLVRVAVDSQDLVVALVLRCDFTVRTHAECAHLVIKGGRVEKCLDLIELVRYILSPGRGYFHPYANIYGQGLDLQSKLLHGFFHPCSAFASGCQKDPVGADLFPVRKQYAGNGSVRFEQDFFYHCVCPYLTTVFYGLIYGTKDLLRSVCSHMAYCCRYYIEACLKSFGNDLLCKVAAWFEQRAAGSVLQIYMVRLVDKREKLLASAVFFKVAPEFRGQCKFTVAESARASPSAYNIARIAVYAFRSAGFHWANTGFYGSSLVNEKNFFTIFYKFESCKQSCGT